MATSRAIGIDLGTTYSCVGVFENGNVEIVANNFGNRITPSVVSFEDEEVTVGEAAKDGMPQLPKNTIFAIKRLIGRRFDDPLVKKDMKNWPFYVTTSKGNAAVKLDTDAEKNIYVPEEISALILNHMKKIAQDYLGHPVTDAVITVPAYFTDAQRQATFDAGKIAGLNVLQILNEPTAAALAYGFKKDKKEEIILVYDFGGGTFDVSIIKVQDGYCQVLAVSGDDHLGGEDFDERLIKHCIEEFKRKDGVNISKNPRVLARLRIACEKAKRVLSFKSLATITLEVGDVFLQYKITRARFNELCSDLIDRTIAPVKEALDFASLDKSAIADIILVGGSTRIPLVQKTLSDFFDGKELKCNINADEAVAYGATLLAAFMTFCTDSSIKNIRFLDVTPHSLGISTRNKTQSGMFAKIIDRNTRFPVEMTSNFTTTNDNETSLSIRIFEGENPNVDKNHLLGKFTLQIPAAPAGAPSIDVTFKIDENGILSVTAVDVGSGNKNSIQIQNDKGRLTQTEIVQMIEDIKSVAIDEEDYIF